MATELRHSLSEPDLTEVRRRPKVTSMVNRNQELQANDDEPVPSLRADASYSDEVTRIANRFPEGADGDALVCPEVWNDGRPILCVCRTPRRGLQFLCEKDHSNDGEDGGFVVVSLAAVIERDRSVEPVATMRLGHFACRDGVDDPWVPFDDLTYRAADFEFPEQEAEDRKLKPLDLVGLRRVLQLIPRIEARSPPFSVPQSRYEDGMLVLGLRLECSEVAELNAALCDARLVQLSYWPTWMDEAERYFEEPELIEHATSEVLIRLFTTHVRKDRFCDGHLASMLDSGHIQALLRRLVAIFGDVEDS